MVDSFDTNVARRKPNVVKKPRPAHPWDVPSDINTVNEGDQAQPIKEEKSESINLAPQVPEQTQEKHLDIYPGPSQPPALPSQPKKSTLSDAINIHSNYCKLDNNVSDYLLCRLSPSAQSVYVRLYRQSFGWNRNWASESLPKLTKACNLSLQTVRKAIRELETLGCIRKEFNDYHKATVYRIYLPSEIGIGKDVVQNTAILDNGRLNNDSLLIEDRLSPPQDSSTHKSSNQNIPSVTFYENPSQNLDGKHINIGGQTSAIQSVYFSGTNGYALLEQGGSLPKNISKNINDIHLREAISIIDEFYDSIGFSIVSRSLYRKSLIDYFELIKAGFSSDDIRYAVRWTFKNSRSRPESFSLIKHTMHLAMDDLITELKHVSQDTHLVQAKQEELKKSFEQKEPKQEISLSTKDMKIWQDVINELKKNLNEHSFSAFIEPLKLETITGDIATMSAPQDSVSWVRDHYFDLIQKVYREKTGKEITVKIV